MIINTLLCIAGLTSIYRDWQILVIIVTWFTIDLEFISVRANKLFFVKIKLGFLFLYERIETHSWFSADSELFICAWVARDYDIIYLNLAIRVNFLNLERKFQFAICWIQIIFVIKANSGKGGCNSKTLLTGKLVARVKIPFLNWLLHIHFLFLE